MPLYKLQSSVQDGSIQIWMRRCADYAAQDHFAVSANDNTSIHSLALITMLVPKYPESPSHSNIITRYNSPLLYYPSSYPLPHLTPLPLVPSC